MPSLQDRTMSMPGFDFFARCNSCGAESPQYPLYQSLFDSSILLPAWSITNRCWAEFIGFLSPDHRKQFEEFEEGPKSLREFAASMSSSSLTIGVPRISAISREGFSVIMSPEPVCPMCGCRVSLNSGSHERESEPERFFTDLSTEEFKGLWLGQFPLSVRARNILKKLGTATIESLLRVPQQEIATRFPNSDGAVREFNEILAIKGLTLN